jgi:catechol 2,3-dioxygenase-like lactoylglutathione lyase family enzyme
MKRSGLNHLGLSTRNVDGTIEFYRDTLGFPIVRYDRAGITEGGAIRHVFFDCGNGQTISFVGPEGVPDIPEWDTGISKGLGVPRGFYHFAFHSDSEEDLAELQAQLIQKGVEISPIMDHDWCKSIYFDDPINGLSLEYCAYTREFTEDDRTLSTRFTASIKVFDYDNDVMKLGEADRLKILRERGLISAAVDETQGA